MIFFTALRKELLEQWSSYRLLIVVAVLLFFGLLSPVTAKYTLEAIKLALPNGEEIAALLPLPSVNEAVEQYLGNLSQFGVVIALLVTMGTVAQEKDKGTAALMLAKPLPRGIFLLAKLVAIALTFAVSFTLAGAACYYYTLILFEAMDIAAWVALNGLMFLLVLVYIALTLLCSTLTKSQVAAGGMAFGATIILASVSAVPGIGEYLPGQLISWGVALMAGSSAAYWPALGVSIGITAAALASAWAIFRRQEL